MSTIVHIQQNPDRTKTRSLFGILTLLLALSTAAAQTWFWLDHDAWIVQQTYPAAISTISGHISSDRKRLIASVGGQPYVTTPFSVYDLKTGKEISRFGPTQERTQGAWLSPDGGHALVFGIKSAVLWDVGSGSRVAELKLHELQNYPSLDPYRVRFTPDGRGIIAVEYHSATLYNAATGAEIGPLEQADARQPYSSFADASVIYSPDGSKALLPNDGNKQMVRIHNTPDASIAAEYVADRPMYNAFCAVFSPDGATLTFGERWLSFVDAVSGQTAAPSVDLAGHFHGIWYSPDGRSVLVVEDAPFPTTALTAVNAQTGKMIASLWPDLSVPGGLVWSPGDNKPIGKEIPQSEWNKPPQAPAFRSPIWSPDGKQILLTQSAYRIDVLDAATLRPTHTLPDNSPGNSSMLFSPDGSRAVVMLENPARVELYSTSDWQPVSVLEDRWHGMKGNFTDALFLQNSRHLLTTTDSGNVMSWMQRRPDTWWGIGALPQFWLAAVFSIGLCWSAWRDIPV